MNIHLFLEHHGILRNPFAEEDAQTDPVFKEHCISNAYHPIWDKVYGDPSEPSTSIIFGPKGSGKTAMRLQIDRHLTRYNLENPDRRVYVIHYDDFNPFLDHFSERLSRRVSKKPEKVLDAWRLWDHVDSILCIGVTDLVDRMLGVNDNIRTDAIDDASIRSLDRTSARDLLLLAACYDQSTDSSFLARWNSLRKHLKFGNLASKTTWIGAIAWSVLSVMFVAWFFPPSTLAEGGRDLTSLWLLPLMLVIGWLPHWIRMSKCQFAALGMHKHMRVGKRETSSMRKVLQSIPAVELASQPLPRYDRTDDRYELLHKFQGILRRLGYTGIIVLMDRVDEPHLTGGKPELMQRFVWPMLDNKLLKHPGMGFKMMLPQELHREIERETREFHERARLDKQNVIPAFQWTGEALYDLARARMIACAADNQTPEPKDLFEDDVSYQRMLSAYQSLRVPRHLFRFLYRVLVDHCNRYTDSEPEFKIKAETFESVLAVYGRDNDPNFT
ncbi:hypothetical protein Pla52o_46190 [Novipirellula galeiformis]|uniref:Uncharacterized protein n=1 Tax=Novipirellula galeiformis TaxID=2528004 RepID=A0A5C6C7N2_9BACT|nr:hypothetical protein [Novipirellula galeiformis]TWU20105.1 hypothetical protein Pla52o_46190 [Novipirellula galeiformis]